MGTKHQSETGLSFVNTTNLLSKCLVGVQPGRVQSDLMLLGDLPEGEAVTDITICKLREQCCL